MMDDVTKKTGINQMNSKEKTKENFVDNIRNCSVLINVRKRTAPGVIDWFIFRIRMARDAGHEY